LGKWESKEAWEAALKELAEKIAKHPHLSKSEPPLDFEFLAEVEKSYSYQEIREQLNKVRLWILAGNSRENYRPTLLAFLKRAVYTVCPKCSHEFKITR